MADGPQTSTARLPGPVFRAPTMRDSAGRPPSDVAVLSSSGGSHRQHRAELVRASLRQLRSAWRSPFGSEEVCGAAAALGPLWETSNSRGGSSACFYFPRRPFVIILGDAETGWTLFRRVYFGAARSVLVRVSVSLTPRPNSDPQRRLDLLRGHTGTRARVLRGRFCRGSCRPTARLYGGHVLRFGSSTVVQSSPDLWRGLLRS
ncbi:hypothetical protein MRX96_004471 [Rhipicephalus microplus]